MDCMEHEMIFKGTHVAVKHPQRREFLLFILQDLSNKDFQIDKWCSPSAKHFVWDNLGYAYDILFDDLLIDTQPEEMLGYVFVNEKEIQALMPLGKALDDVFNTIGPNQPDTAYINSPLWDKVIDSAAAAFKVFMANEGEAKKITPHPCKRDKKEEKSSQEG